METWKNGSSLTVLVALTNGGNEPFTASPYQGPTGMGTEPATCDYRTDLLPVSAVAEAIGSKFLVDPLFSIVVNGDHLELLSLSGVATVVLPVEPHGEATVHQIDALVQDRTTLLRGITGG